jgi:hypothetical protein
MRCKAEFSLGESHQRVSNQDQIFSQRLLKSSFFKETFLSVKTAQFTQQSISIFLCFLTSNYPIKPIVVINCIFLSNWQQNNLDINLPIISTCKRLNTWNERAGKANLYKYKYIINRCNNNKRYFI